MKYKDAAGLFVGGICSILAGSLIVFIAITFGTRMAFNNGSIGLDLPFLVVAAIGGLFSIVGVILLIGATYRALVKIDALQVTVPSSSREAWPADRR
ncbi:hypothetical protein ACFY5D_21585 [Paeniglutamicibacter sp. NPDC012692]|uniref:hypothetical protein n=1 Tax=Paeniglutamicibacter sp. NPDC012692 TaxID=3364388 RepID=UPI00368F6510